MNTIFRDRIYEIYRADWLISHGYSLYDLYDRISHISIDMAEEGMRDLNEARAMEDVWNAFEEQGFNGEIWACKEEFFENEFKDKDYIKSLLDRFGYNNGYKYYLQELEKDLDIDRDI